jgi:hypothetical protein
MKFNIWEFYEQLLCHVRFNLDETCLTKILHEDLYACLRYLVLFIGEKHVFNKRGEKYSTYLMFNTFSR